MDLKFVTETFALGTEFWKTAHTCPHYKLFKNGYLIFSDCQSYPIVQVFNITRCTVRATNRITFLTFTTLGAAACSGSRETIGSKRLFPKGTSHLFQPDLECR